MAKNRKGPWPYKIGNFLSLNQLNACNRVFKEVTLSRISDVLSADEIKYMSEVCPYSPNKSFYNAYFYAVILRSIGHDVRYCEGYETRGGDLHAWVKCDGHFIDPTFDHHPELPAVHMFKAFDVDYTGDVMAHYGCSYPLYATEHEEELLAMG